MESFLLPVNLFRFAQLHFHSVCFPLRVCLHRHRFFLAVPVEGCCRGVRCSTSVITSTGTFLLLVDSSNKWRSQCPSLVALARTAMSTRTKRCKPLTGTLPTDRQCLINALVVQATAYSLIKAVPYATLPLKYLLFPATRLKAEHTQGRQLQRISVCCTVGRKFLISLFLCFFLLQFS